MIRRLLSALTDWLSPAPLDLGLPELVPAAEVLDIVDRVRVRECRADAAELVSDADLLALVYGSGVPFRDHTVPHEPTAAERGWAA